MSVSADGYITDRHGAIDWSVPGDDLFRFHLERVRELGAILLGRRLYETMLVWETDPTLRVGEMAIDFANVWSALPKVVFSRTLTRVDGNATRLARASLADELAAVRASTDQDVEIGGATLAVSAFEAGLIDEVRLFRHPVLLGGGTPFFPAVSKPIRLDLVESQVFESQVVYERYRIQMTPG